MLRLNFLQNKSMTFHTADKYIVECIIRDLQNTDVFKTLLCAFNKT